MVKAYFDTNDILKKVKEILENRETVETATNLEKEQKEKPPSAGLKM